MLHKIKRKRDGQDSAAAHPGPRQRKEDNKPFQEGRKIPINVLETTWSVGRNRHVKPAHVQELKEAFIKGGLKRSAPKNRITVLCSVKDVRRIQQSTGEVSSSNTEDNEDNNKDVEAAFLR
ncbi:hypothetical protein LX36DRAFT_736744 [Colletotrichum falcatum]|nr:hypothetical protein LX36DRAFT_736744 [Colletotrichum falcatum]